MRKKPSFKEFLYTDYYILGPLSSGVLLIVIGLYFIIFEKNQFGLIGFCSAGLFIMFLSIIRLFILKNLFNVGVEVKGKITNISPIRRSYRVTLEYTYDNKLIKTVWISVRNLKIQNLKNLEEVTILLNPNKVKQSVVIEAFNLSN